MSERGAFISIEGGDGAGKSTQLGVIEQLLQRHNIDYILTREPGGTPLAEHIRRLILVPDTYPIEDVATEVMLMMSARMHHLNRVIIPRLAEGCWVICDRFTDSTVAYQGYASGFNVEKILRLADIVHGDCWPDLTLLFDVPVQVSKQRRKERRATSQGSSQDNYESLSCDQPDQTDQQDQQDRFEAEGEHYQMRVRQGYLAMAKQFPKRIRVIDAAQSIEGVSRSVNDVITEFIVAQSTRSSN